MIYYRGRWALPLSWRFEESGSLLVLLTVVSFGLLLFPDEYDYSSSGTQRGSSDVCRVRRCQVTNGFALFSRLMATTRDITRILLVVIVYRFFHLTSSYYTE